MVALVTLIGGLEPYYNWRSRWVLMEETRYRLNRIRDTMDYYLVTTPDADISQDRLGEFFKAEQEIWSDVSRRWIEFRKVDRTPPTDGMSSRTDNPNDAHLAHCRDHHQLHHAAEGARHPADAHQLELSRVSGNQPLQSARQSHVGSVVWVRFSRNSHIRVRRATFASSRWAAPPGRRRVPRPHRSSGGFDFANCAGHGLR